MENTIAAQLERLAAELSYGDGLAYSREILKDECTDEIEQLAKDLLEHNAFDLSLLIPGFKPSDNYDDDFRYQNTTLTEWLGAVSEKRVAALVCHIVLTNETAWASRENQAVQDYYAEHCWQSGGINYQSEFACEGFLERSLKCMEKIKQHYRDAADLGLCCEEVRVVDALWSWTPHPFDNDTVEAGKEIVEKVNEMLPNKQTIRSDVGARTYIINTLQEIQRIANEHDVDVDIKDHYSLTTGYLTAWLDDKYWGDRREEEQW